MLKSIVVSGVLLASLTACQMNNQTGGTLIGAGAGGLLGSQVGGGSGRLIATGVGTLIGAVAGSSVGQSMDQKQTVIYKEVGADVCSDYKSNEGAYSACQKGVARRNAEMQRRLENEAYNQGLGK